MREGKNLHLRIAACKELSTRASREAERVSTGSKQRKLAGRHIKSKPRESKKHGSRIRPLQPTRNRTEQQKHARQSKDHRTLRNPHSKVPKHWFRTRIHVTRSFLISEVVFIRCR
ncbi:hypothetical protein C7212DRAFT_327681 [Tuber magnatum]|uniref:Uncharacterized protein n=1 Tax=Tuber magnatum TaxID=42249 RepID=A0A317SJS8_9PEZI|nr:hypothetical protein C7212DRAFT_327681 [Tuber magnatum]